MAGKGRPGRPVPPIELTEHERRELEGLARRRKTAQGLAKRARLILACADGDTNIKAAEAAGLTRETAGKWRRRFAEHRLDGLYDEPRPGPPRTISDAQVEEVVVKTLESTPKGQTHWTRSAMAKEVGLSSATIGRIWKAFGLKPHRSETFKLSPDPLFIDKVRDIVGLYMAPPMNAVVLCLDEKSQIQAVNRSQPILPMRPGQVERRSHDYERHGTTTLFAALNAGRGEVINKCYRSHRTSEFIKFLNQVDNEVPSEVEQVHVVMDNYGTHKTPVAKRWFERHPRWIAHFTPTYSSWLNLVERFFAELTNRAVRRGSFTSVRALEKAIYAFLDTWNEDPNPFVWTASADTILRRLNNFCERTCDGGH
jgi:transposase